MGYLSYRLQERLTLYIARRAAYLGHYYVSVGLLAHAVYKFFYLIGDMRDYLHGFAEIIAVALFIEYVPIYLTRRKIGILIELYINKSLIVSKIEICLRSVLRDVHFSVFQRIHSAGVYVDVRIELLRHYLQSSGFEQSAEARHSDTLAKSRYNSSCHKYIFRHTSTSPSYTFTAPPVM